MLEQATLDQLLQYIQTGPQDVRLDVSESNSSSTLAIASSQADERTERLRQGERVVNVYRNRDAHNDDWVSQYGATAEQVEVLRGAGAMWIGPAHWRPPGDWVQR